MNCMMSISPYNYTLCNSTWTCLKKYCPYLYTVISSVGADGQSGGFDSSNYTLNPISSSAKGRVRLDDLLT